MLTVNKIFKAQQFVCFLIDLYKLYILIKDLFKNITLGRISYLTSGNFAQVILFATVVASRCRGHIGVAISESEKVLFHI